MRSENVRIDISTDGDRTVAEAVIYGYWGFEAVTGKGSSSRERGDKADQVTGDDLAMARALRSVAAKIERRAQGRIRHAESVKAHRAEIAARGAPALIDSSGGRGHIEWDGRLLQN